MEAKIKNVEDINVFYDGGHDTLYISFGKVKEADDSELTGNDIVVRYRKGKIIGVTVLEFSKRTSFGAEAQKAEVSTAA